MIGKRPSLALPFVHAANALVANRDDIGDLELVVPRRSQHMRATSPILDVSFLTGSVRSSGSTISLRDGERALLFAIAHHREPAHVDRLTDLLWPELDGERAVNALRVRLHRLRKGLGDSRAVIRSTRAYTLRSGAVVDLWSIRETLSTLRDRSAWSALDRYTLIDIHARLRAGRAARTSQRAWFSPYATELAALTRDANWMLGLEALARGDANEALRLGHVMIEDDRGDETGHEFAIRSHLATGDRSAAIRQHRAYRKILAERGEGGRATALDALITETRRRA